MKLTSNETQNLEAILSTAILGGIEAIVIEDGYVRGANPSKTFAIISNFNVPMLPQKMGLARLGSLIQRISILKSNDMMIDAKESDRGEITSLEMVSGKNKAQFRCTSTMLIKAPKSISDDHDCKISISKEEMKMILDAIRVMGTKKVVLSIRKGGAVQFEMADDSNDSFKVALEATTDREDDAVVHYYSAPILSAVIKSKMDFDVAAFDIGKMGTIKTTVNGHGITILPQVGDDTED